jgi:hypothetical protein
MDSSVTSALRIEADDIESSSDDGAMKENPVDENDESKEEELDRNLPEISLPQRQKTLWIARKTLGGSRSTLSNSSIQ